ncbi:hypothetical protein [Thiohalobacter sp. COW1]|uniref:hypothetical protein n=1 Tax=Thiohalobacter sp. COW1 TaxID=2795687 RepID=UPI0019167F67|nr:hypothetical protein [Thiohalobacter sp. COW1]
MTVTVTPFRSLFFRGSKIYQYAYRLRLAVIIVAGFNVLHMDTPQAGELIAGDLAPRDNPDGEINGRDIVVLQRIILGDIDPTPTERLVADVGPLTGADGVLNVADVLILTRAVFGEIELAPIVDNGAPENADVSKITVLEDGEGEVTVTGDNNAVEGHAEISLVNYETGERVVTQADEEGGFSASIGGVSGEVIAVIVTDAAGNKSGQAGVAVGDFLSVNITSPASGSTIDADSVLVSGTYTGPSDTAITINGVSACTINNSFYANGVSLDDGTNELRATARIVDNVGAEKSVYVYSSGPSQLRVSTTPACGIAPQEVVFSITNDTTVQIDSIEFDANADGAMDAVLTDDVDEIRHTYINPGVYQSVATFHYANGERYDIENMIVVRPVSDIDAKLRAVYSRMLDRLRVGAIEGAMTHITSTMRNKYSSTFHSSQDKLANIIDQLGVLHGGAIGENIAQYIVLRSEGGKDVGFSVFFVRGADGVWRIGEM